MAAASPTVMAAVTSQPKIVKPLIMACSAFQRPRAMSRAKITMGARFRTTIIREKPAVRPPAKAPTGMVMIPASTPWARNLRSS